MAARSSCSLWHQLRARERGTANIQYIQTLSQRQRLASLDISAHMELSSAHEAPVTSLSLDAVESRYLLSSSADATIGLYDVEDKPCDPKAEATLLPRGIEPLAVIPKAHAHAHRSSVSAMQWFPHDTGLFASAGHDGLVKLWDTNELMVACDFTLPGRVHCLAMSAIATTHTHIATGAEGTSSIHLCDASTGSAAQVLVGHRAPVWALCWSPRCEYTLASGGADRSVRLWDIRRAGSCLRALDQHDTRDERKRLTTASTSLSARAAIATALASSSSSGKSARSSSSSSSANTTVAAAARELATPCAHNGPVSSLCYCADGLMLLTAGRDHRMRLWDATTGANTLTHYPGAFNTARGHKQLGVTSAGAAAAHARVYFPGNDGLLVFDLLTGRKLQTLKAHLGEVVCCAASPRDARVFTGGSDSTIHVWTPPPCGLSKPTPAEKPEARVAAAAGLGARFGEGAGQLGVLPEAYYYGHVAGSGGFGSGGYGSSGFGDSAGLMAEASFSSIASCSSSGGGGGGGSGGRSGGGRGGQSGGGGARAHGDCAGASNSSSSVAGSGGGVAVEEDGDAWSDEDEEEAAQAAAKRAAAQRRRRAQDQQGGTSRARGGGASKRPRVRGPS